MWNYQFNYCSKDKDPKTYPKWFSKFEMCTDFDYLNICRRDESDPQHFYYSMELADSALE